MLPIDLCYEFTQFPYPKVTGTLCKLQYREMISVLYIQAYFCLESVTLQFGLSPQRHAHDMSSYI